MSAHTPGPWRVQPDGQGIMFSGSAGFSFTPWGNTAPLSEADARLIAAAPELLEAIEYALDHGYLPAETHARLATAARATKGETS